MKTTIKRDAMGMRASYKRSDFGEMKRGAFVEFARRALEKTATAKLSADGRITVPKIVRDALDLEPGATMVLTVQVDGTVILRKKPQ